MLQVVYVRKFGTTDWYCIYLGYQMDILAKCWQFYAADYAVATVQVISGRVKITVW